MSEPAIDYDADGIYQLDLKHKAIEDVDTAVYAYGKRLKLEPAQCAECMAKVREVLKAYEHP